MKTSLNLPKNQQGATLIMVMLVLLLVATIGTYAFKRSSADLAVATSNQVRKVLFQSADAGLTKFEIEARTANRLETLDGPVSIIKLATDPSNTDLIFCSQLDQTSLYSIQHVTQKQRNQAAGSGYENNLNNGYCNLDNANHYTSSRQAAVNQLTFQKLGSQTQQTEAFGSEYELTTDPTKGQKINSKTNPTAVEYYRLISTSTIPSFAGNKQGKSTDLDTRTVSGCLKQGAEKTQIDDCLKNLSAPYASQFQDYRLDVRGFNKIN